MLHILWYLQFKSPIPLKYCTGRYEAEWILQECHRRLVRKKRQSENNNDNNNNNNINNNNKKIYAKPGVGFTTSKLLQDMNNFNYKRSKEVEELMNELVQTHFSRNSKRNNFYCHSYTMTSDFYFIMDKLLNNVVIFTGNRTYF